MMSTIQICKRYENTISSNFRFQKTVLEAISDNESLNLLRSIANDGRNIEGLMHKLKMTRKQYCSRLTILLDAGLIKRKNNAYSLTSFGKVIFEVQLILTEVIDSRSKFKTVGTQDSFREVKKIIDKLVSGN
jgi:predicted transcriptional regulator